VTRSEAVAGGAHDAVDEAIAKGRAREPEMAFAEVFCPRATRPRFALWGALVFAWRQAAFELSDARPTEAKCTWWADEALRSAQGAPRHPLTRALPALELPWLALSEGLLAVASEEPRRPIDRANALASVAPLADALSTMECALFSAKGGTDARRAVAVHLLCERLRVGLSSPDGGRVPLSMLARHGIAAGSLDQTEGEPAVRDWARELLDELPSRLPDAPLYRRTRRAFDAWHLSALAAGRRKALPPSRALLLAWQAARQGRPAG
jgi:hypothetical protein